jgi:hypothetical protein
MRACVQINVLITRNCNTVDLTSSFVLTVEVGQCYKQVINSGKLAVISFLVTARNSATRPLPSNRRSSHHAVWHVWGWGQNWQLTPKGPHLFKQSLILWPLIHYSPTSRICMNKAPIKGCEIERKKYYGPLKEYSTPPPPKKKTLSQLLLEFTCSIQRRNNGTTYRKEA